MNSSMIGKIAKARRYAQERERVHFEDFRVTFEGENDTYDVRFDGAWHCSCEFFTSHAICCHTMAMERILSGMLPAGSPQSERVLITG